MPIQFAGTDRDMPRILDRFQIVKSVPRNIKRMSRDPEPRRLRSANRSTPHSVRAAGTQQDDKSRGNAVSNTAGVSPASDRLIEEDVQLIASLVRHDSGAWQTFVDQYQRLIYSRVLHTLDECGSNSSAADDVCAEVFVGLLHNDCASLRQFQGRSRLSTWLFIVARRICLRYVSGRKSLQTVGLSDPAIPNLTRADCTQDVFQRDDLSAMQSALDQLGDADQLVLKMFYFDNQSYHEIGEALNISINTVGPKLHRATKRLRKAFDQGTASR